MQSYICIFCKVLSRTWPIFLNAIKRKFARIVFFLYFYVIDTSLILRGVAQIEIDI